MGYSKRIFGEEQEREMFDQIDGFFNADYLTIDVRVRFQISIDQLDKIVDHRHLKKDIRRKMMSQFRKQLTKELKDKL